MATGGASLRLKRLRQRFGINAPKLAVRTHYPWYMRAMAVIAMLAIILVLAAWIFEAGQRTATFQSTESARENQFLKDRVVELDTELTRLRDSQGAGESSLQIAQATQQQLTLQINALEEQNAALKQELAFFEGLMSSAQPGGRESGVAIERLRVEPEAASGRYRYRILIVNNSAVKQTKEFKGTLELLLKVRQGNKDVMISLPSKDEPHAGNFRLEIKYYQRLEGSFSLPLGATLKNVEARVFRDGQLRARQSLAL